MGRLPVRVRTKLLVAFVGTVLLLVVVGVLGLRVLGQSNSRVERLGALQVRATAYRAIQAGVAEGRDLLGLRAGGSDVISYAGGVPQTQPTGQSLVSLDQQIRAAFAQVGLAASADGLGFAPPAPDESILRRMLSESSGLSGVMQKIIAADQSAGSAGDEKLQAQAEASATRLRDLTTELVNRTQADTDALIAQNRSSFHAFRSPSLSVAITSSQRRVAAGCSPFINTGTLRTYVYRGMLNSYVVSSLAPDDLVLRCDAVPRKDLKRNRLSSHAKRISMNVGEL